MIVPDELPPLSSVMIATRDNGRETVQGYDLGLLAITPDCGVESDDACWVVTHLPTGFVISSRTVTFETPQSALAYARRVAATDLPLLSSEPDAFTAPLRACAADLIRASHEAGAARTDWPMPVGCEHLDALWESE